MNSRSNPAKYKNLLVTLFFLVYAIVMLVMNLKVPIGGDEPFSIFYAQRSTLEIINALKYGNNPPLFEIILHFWIHLFGTSTLAVKALPVLFNTLTSFFIYRLILTKFNTLMALMGAVLLAVSNLNFGFLLDVRAYSLLAWLTTMLIFFIVTKKLDSLRSMLPIVLVSIVMIYTHYFGILIVFTLGAVVALNAATKKTYSLKVIGVGYLIILASLAPIVPLLFMQAHYAVSNGNWLQPIQNVGNLHDSFLHFLNGSRLLYLIGLVCLYTALSKRNRTKLKKASILVLFALLAVSSSVHFNLPFIWKLTSQLWFNALFLITLLFFTIRAMYKSRTDIYLLSIISVGFLLPLLIYILSLWIPLYTEKYISFAFPCLAIIILGSIIELFAVWRSRYVLTGCFIIIMVLGFDTNAFKQTNIVEVTDDVKSWKTDDECIVITPYYCDKVFLYHYNKAIFNNYQNYSDELVNNSIFKVNSVDQIALELSKKNYLILVKKFCGETHTAESNLLKHFHLVKEKKYEDQTVIEYYSRN